MRFWLAYDGLYLALRGARRFGGFGSSRVLGLMGAPIFVNWLVASMRWIATGSPGPRN